MAEHSTASQKKDRKSTTKTEKGFTPEEALEILAKSLLILSKSGVSVSIMPLHDQGEQSTGIVLEGIQVIDKKFVISTGIPSDTNASRKKSTGIKDGDE